MLTRISDEKILRVLQGTSHEGSIVDIHKRERRNLLDAQLDADQEKAQEIFEGIRDIFDELYPPPLPNPEMPLKLWYRIQALKERWLK